ncbi:MAG: putative metal-binding motif-containing protein, partial [Myxococcales bacterium]|nr:putative metal-binding motif-containing protein [Myxococcales bacterium]
MKPASAGKVTFQFKFTAPAAGSSVTLSAWGNAVNGIAAATGDQASSASLVVAVSSVCPDSDGDGATAKTCGGTDCDDTNSAVKPGATEACNGTDDDCDGQTDEGLTKPTFYRDQDQDGFGDPAVTVQACT